MDVLGEDAGGCKAHEQEPLVLATTPGVCGGGCGRPLLVAEHVDAGSHPACRAPQRKGEDRWKTPNERRAEAEAAQRMAGSLNPPTRRGWS